MGMSNIFLTICMCIFMSMVSSLNERKIYIVYMGSLPEGEYSPSLHHSQIINEVIHPSFASQALIRSYERSFNGFAAYVSEEEKEKLTRIVGVVSVFPCQKLQLQTTRSWDFMGLSRSVERRVAIESDIIIGVIDTGIWPESESFNDEGYGPIPTKWKGECDGGKDFVCNRKIIGARSYVVDSKELSARDTVGHGTHVASILAGNQVRHSSYYGLAHGIARGGVPSARLAIYKVCGSTGCDYTDVLSAFDQAIVDGVDIISISIGNNDPLELTFDPIAIGAFHAIERGILTVNSAGNKGPSRASIYTYAPWIFTVAASDIDRKIVDKLLLGKDATLVGHAINVFPSSDEPLPLVYGKEVTSRCPETDAKNCLIECLESSLVDHKVVLCDKEPILEELKKSRASGFIYPSIENYSLVMPLPVVALSRDDLNSVKKFKKSTTEPLVQILRSEPIDNPGAPFVAPFSSRGPGIYIHDMIKPDIIAPGVEILAAFSSIGSPSGITWDKNFVEFSILSGTSMACPHVVAAAAFVKSFHPEWSPSAIKSALMTTAWELSASLYSEAEFAYGSGHIDPLKATTPGLVYETSFQEYLKIWCNISRTPGSVIPTSSSCPTKSTAKDINYPSMAVQVKVGALFAVAFPRTVTNVGRANSTYVSHIEGEPSKLHVSVEPDTLQFTKINQKKFFSLTVRGNKMKPFTIKHLSLVWSDGVHKVRSPIVVYTMSHGEPTPTPTPSMLCITFMLIILIALPLY
ncbi:putative cucumisin [Helianthus annuus]|nr:putative cucumisin [Helianthus annuus]KAJ0506787.1 putative cucumisin [Helianthus annuus]KAJ0868289.1 putative cucumisin [Helianthus annuus]